MIASMSLQSSEIQDETSPGNLDFCYGVDIPRFLQNPLESFEPMASKACVWAWL